MHRLEYALTFLRVETRREVEIEVEERGQLLGRPPCLQAALLMSQSELVLHFKGRQCQFPFPIGPPVNSYDSIVSGACVSNRQKRG